MQVYFSIHFNFFFIERVNETDAVEPVPCQPWSSRGSKMTQPNLDFMGECNISRNMCIYTLAISNYNLIIIYCTYTSR